MANYYSYGEIPMASEEALTEEFSPLTTAPAAPTVVPPEGFARGTIGSLYVPGATIPAGVDPNAPIDLSADQVGALGNMLTQADLMKKRDVLSFEPGLTSGYMGLGFLDGGVPVTPEMRNIQGTPEAGPPVVDPALAAQVKLTPEQLKAIEDVFQPQVSEEDKAAIAARPRVQALSKISGLLKENKFSEAFQSALDAEKELGGDFLDNLVNPDKLRMLRGPMTADEIRAFYSALPQEEYAKRYVGPGNIYKIDQALERNLAALGDKPGYVDPRGGAKAKGSIVSDIVDVAPYAFAALVAPQLYGALTGAAAPGAAAAAPGAAGAGGGLGAAGAGAGAGAGALGTAGVAASALPEIVITATKLGLTIPQAAALLSATGAAAGALGGGAAPAATTGATTQAPLEEVVVQGTKPVAGGLANVAAPALAAATQVTQPAATAGGQPAEPYQPTEQPLEEVVVQGTRPVVDPSVFSILPTTLASNIAGPGAVSDIPTDIYGQVEPTPEVTEGKVEATEEGVKTPYDEITPEVLITGSKPIPPGPVLAALGAASLPALSSMMPTSEIGEVELIKEPSKLETELDKLESELAAPVVPPKGILDQLSELFGSQESLNSFLEALGALGGALSAGKPTTGPAAPTAPTGFGGALPKYEFKRTQLQPQIDYYRYGLGPEAKFFEDKLVPAGAPPAQGPPASMVNPEDQPVFAHGGLARGGRYMEGEGSGRDDTIPALLSDGEYVMDAETLALLGDGSPKEGAKRMDEFRAKIRQHKGRAISRGRISPNAKSPDKYMGGGLT